MTKGVPNVTCKACGKGKNLHQDELSKDWWHKKCHEKIHIITKEEERNFQPGRLRHVFIDKTTYLPSIYI